MNSITRLTPQLGSAFFVFGFLLLLASRQTNISIAGFSSDFVKGVCIGIAIVLFTASIVLFARKLRAAA
jgi:tetrahydromethanopterin S-methyltransferase subunit B